VGRFVVHKPAPVDPKEYGKVAATVGTAGRVDVQIETIFAATTILVALTREVCRIPNCGLP
jgi:hypothetical protein